MTSKKYNKIIVGIITFPILIFGVFNYLVDPLQYYHISYLSPRFINNQRQQNPGLAKNYPYDTVIIGTSHTENILSSNVQKYLGLKSLKLSMSGATAHEQALILTLALSTGKVKNVIWALELERFNEGTYTVSDRNGGFPMHLYAGGLSALFKYLLSIDTLKLSFDLLNGNGEKNLEQLNTWYDKNEFSILKVKENYDLYCLKALEKNMQKKQHIENLKYDIDDSLIVNLHNIIYLHKDVNFYLLFPPASMAKYYLNIKYYPNRISEMIQFKGKVFDKVGNYNNVNIYDFQKVESLTNNLSFYKDISHYNIDINNYILKSIRKGSHKYNNTINIENEFIKKIKGYKLPFKNECQ